MTPVAFLSILIAATAAAVVVQVVTRQAHMTRLRQLAARWQMHYTAGDRFRLAPRIANRLGIPGAASVSVQDVIYGSEGDFYRYFFTAQYTIGVLKRKIDESAVCTVTERKSREPGDELGEVSVASGEVSIVEQYEQLKKGLEKEGRNSHA